MHCSHIFAQLLVTLFYFYLERPAVHDVAQLVATHDIFMEGLGSHLLLGDGTPGVENLVQPSRLEVVSNLVLFLLESVGPAPHPQVLGTLDALDLLDLGPFEFLAQIITLQSHETLLQSTQAVAVGADGLELAQNDSFAQAVEYRLHDVALVLLFDFLGTIREQLTCMITLQGMHSQLHYDGALQLELCAPPERLTDLTHEYLLAHLVDEFNLVILKTSVLHVVVDLQNVRLLY